MAMISLTSDWFDEVGSKLFTPGLNNEGSLLGIYKRSEKRIMMAGRSAIAVE